MSNLNIAGRNLLRNSRRSLATLTTMIIGITALLLFGGYVASIYYGMQEGLIREQGHLHIYPAGYLDYGSSRSNDFYIIDYEEIIENLYDDGELKDKLSVVTPVVFLSGIAGNYSADASTTFIGVGLVPSEQNTMRKWDYYGLGIEPTQLPLQDDDKDSIIVGFGMARMLNLCEPLSVPACSDLSLKKSSTDTVEDASISDFLNFATEEIESNASDVKNDRPVIDLMVSTIGGAPNAISMSVMAAKEQTVKTLDDKYIAMNISQAQKLIYGNERYASAIILQLKDPNDMEAVKDYLQKKFIGSRSGQSLEIKTYREFYPEFDRIIGMFITIFSFMSVVVALVVLFTIVNTLTMSVMERITEIGTLRALGLRRSGVLSLFLSEGALIGIIGSTLGVLIAIAAAYLFNNAGFTWTPPNSSSSTTLQILLFNNMTLIFGVWLLMFFLSIMSALFPARKASRMNIVDAIRHV